MAERTARVWARIAAAHEGDGRMSVAALCRAAVRSLGVDGAGVTATSGLMAREPLFASDELSARLEELQFTTGEGPGAEDFAFGCADADPGPGVDGGALADFCAGGGDGWRPGPVRRSAAGRGHPGGRALDVPVTARSADARRAGRLRWSLPTSRCRWCWMPRPASAGRRTTGRWMVCRTSALRCTRRWG